jgi:DNA-binding transcriptional ArsR family regulator
MLYQLSHVRTAPGCDQNCSRSCRSRKLGPAKSVLHPSTPVEGSLDYGRYMSMPAQDVSYDPDFAPAAALISDPTRAAILRALLPDRPLAAGELARLAGVSAATASFHLAKLLDGGMIAVARQGRHRYYRLAGHEVAAALEALGLISPTLPVRTLRQSARRPRWPRPGPVTTTWPAGRGWSCSTACSAAACSRNNHQAERTVVIRPPVASKSPGPERGPWVRSA